MNIVVPIKQVPDTGVSLRVNQEKNGIEDGGLKWVLSPYDEFALEESLKLKARFKSKIFALSLGPAHHKEALKNALALGADEAFHLITESSPFDPLVIAQVLSEKIKDLDNVSLVFCGKLATDLNNFAVPQMISYFLKFNSVTNVNKLDFEGEDLILKRECGGGTEEIIKASIPLVLSADKGLNTPRYPSLPGIMQAKKKPFYETKITLPEEKLTQIELRPPEEKKPPQMLEGTPSEQAEKLLRFLKEKEGLL